MTGHILVSLRRGRGRALLLGSGTAAVLTAACVLLGAARVGEIRIDGTLARSFRPAYDLLVRPRTDVTGFERRNRLVRDNFLSGLFGGISESQLAAVRGLPGLEVAPIENVGYVMAAATVRIPFRPPDGGPGHQLFRLSARFELPGGAVSWGSAYVYVSRRGRFSPDGPGEVVERLPGRGGVWRVCGPQSQPAGLASELASPYTAGRLDGSIFCFSESEPRRGSFPGGSVLVPVVFDFPLLLSAVDPGPEARWFGLSRAVVAGRYLNEGERWTRRTGTSLGTVASVPVIASSVSYLGESLVLAQSLVAASNGPFVPRLLSSSAATRRVDRLAGTDEVVTRLGAGRLYRALLRSAMGAGRSSSYLPVPQYWVVRPSAVHPVGRDSVTVSPVTLPPSIWRATPGWGGAESFQAGHEVGYVAAPPGNSPSGYAEVAVRDLRAGTAESGTAGGPPVAALDVVGEFDPSRLAGFSPLSRVPLETFRPPTAITADAAARRLLGSALLRPTTDLAGYIAEPPALLTTLRAATALYGKRYPGSDAARPISALLVRLRGRLGTGAATRARLEAVAGAIRAATGLSVEITDGSSPTPVRVTLRGWRGHRRLALVEGWTRLGVSYTIGSALDGATLALAALAVLAGIVFVSCVVTASLDGRRRELALLSALGWRRRDLVGFVVGEVLVVALLGALGGLAALLLVGAATVPVPPPLDLLGAAVSAAPVAGAAATLPALRASRPARPRRRGRPVATGRLGFALAVAGGTPGRRLAAASLAIGLASFSTLVACEWSFRRDLLRTRTLLGAAAEGRAGGTDLLASAALLALGLAALGATALSGRAEQGSRHAVLAATGWRRRELGRLALAEAVSVALPGLVAGLVAGAAVSAALGVAPGVVLGATVAPAGGSLLLLAGTVGLLRRRAGEARLAELLGERNR